MITRLVFFTLNFIFWIIYFEFSRLIFLVFHFNFAQSLTWQEILTPFLLGIRMDASMSGYWTILTGLLLMIGLFIPNSYVKRLHQIISGLLIVVSTVIVVADIELYLHWNFRLNTLPIFYLSKEGFFSISMLEWFKLLTLMVVIIGISWWSYRRWILRKIDQFQKISPGYAILFLLLTGFMFVPIRGRLNMVPMNTGVVYFHPSKLFPNHLGINPAWSFFRSAFTNQELIYANKIYHKPDLETNFSSLMADEGSAQKLIKKNQPNIILIILESYTSKVIGSLGGLSKVSPGFDHWSKEGILFDHFYASGDRTDKGLVSILSGYPAQPRSSIVKFPSKSQKLPHLTQQLKKWGYSSGFFYGGEVGFANMESYITLSGFDTISDESDYSSSLFRTEWGVADEYVFDELLTACDEAQSPFFNVALTLSSHPPYDVPFKEVFSGDTSEDKFLNACHYADSCLNNFLARAKTKSWWKDTWVIITADHGNPLPEISELHHKSRFAIPMLWVGGAITSMDTVIHNFGNQTDIPATVINQIGFNPEIDFPFSKNILSHPNPFSVYVFNNGYGYMSNQGENTFDFDLKQFIYQNGSDDELVKGQVYLQKLFNDYNAK